MIEYILFFYGLEIAILTLLMGFWTFLIYWLFKKKKKAWAWINVSVIGFMAISILWFFQLLPFSESYYLNKEIVNLTGKDFWPINQYSFQDISVRGEGYDLQIFKIPEDELEHFKSPNADFFTSLPAYEAIDHKWSKTPVSEIEMLDFALMPCAGWEDEILEKQKYINELAISEGSYYAFRHSFTTDFYLISPREKIIVLINHNM